MLWPVALSSDLLSSPPHLKGRRRSIWISISTALYYDAQRDFADLGRPDIPVYALHKLPYGALDESEISDGVMFCTYQSLIAQVPLTLLFLFPLHWWAQLIALVVADAGAWPTQLTCQPHPVLPAHFPSTSEQVQ